MPVRVRLNKSPSKHRDTPFRPRLESISPCLIHQCRVSLPIACLSLSNFPSDNSCTYYEMCTAINMRQTGHDLYQKIPMENGCHTPKADPDPSRNYDQFRFDCRPCPGRANQCAFALTCDGKSTSLKSHTFTIIPPYGHASRLRLSR